MNATTRKSKTSMLTILNGCLLEKRFIAIRMLYCWYFSQRLTAPRIRLLVATFPKAPQAPKELRARITFNRFRVRLYNANGTIFY